MTARVLVVDDVELNVKLLEAKLSSEYFQVIPAFNGPTALELADSELPDIILLDVMMPRMDGFEVCRRLKANRADDRHSRRHGDRAQRHRRPAAWPRSPAPTTS